MIISINGRLFKQKDAKISILDHGLLFGDGIFETLRTFEGRLFKFEEHYERLRHSAKQISMPIPPGKNTLKKQMEQVIKANKLKEARVRVTITRGIGPIGSSIECKRQSVIITAVKLKQKSYEKGVKAITCYIERCLPTVKSLSYLPSVIAKAEATRKKAFEAIMIDKEGYLREGSLSNVFIVKGSNVVTPGTNILKGVTRMAAIDIAKKAGIKVIEKDIDKSELFKADEVFITFTTAGIVPIVKVDNKKFKVGEVTKRLMQLYSRQAR